MSQRSRSSINMQLMLPLGDVKPTESSAMAGDAPHIAITATATASIVRLIPRTLPSSTVGPAGTVTSFWPGPYL